MVFPGLPAAKEDLAKLQRQFRITEDSRRSYTDKAQNSLRKQKYAVSASNCPSTVLYITFTPTPLWGVLLTVCVRRAVIEMLEAENKDLKKNLSLAGSRQNELKDSSITDQFEELIERRLDYERLVAEEQQAISELERRIRERQQQISRQRKDMGG